MDCGPFNGTIFTKLANIKEQLITDFLFAWTFSKCEWVYCNFYGTGIVSQWQVTKKFKSISFDVAPLQSQTISTALYNSNVLAERAPNLGVSHHLEATRCCCHNVALPSSLCPSPVPVFTPLVGVRLWLKTVTHYCHQWGSNPAVRTWDGGYTHSATGSIL